MKEVSFDSIEAVFCPLMNMSKDELHEVATAAICVIQTLTGDDPIHILDILTGNA